MARKVIVLLLLLPFICSEGLAQSRIFWGDAESVAIRSAYLDGTHVSTVAPYGPITGMTVDTRNGWIYYLTVPIGHGVYGELWRMPVSGGPGTRLVESRWTEGGLAIDYGAGKIYWATRLRDMMLVTIMRANLDGTDAEEFAPDVSEFCRGIAVDPVERQVYWTTYTGILRKGIDGGEIQDVTPGALPDHVTTGSIAIDPDARKMYVGWVGGGSSGSSLYRADLDGTNLEELWTDYYSRTGDIVVDAGNSYVYWTLDGGTFGPPWGMKIVRARSNRPINADDIEIVVAPPDTPEDLTKGLALFVDPGPPVLENPASEETGVSTTTELQWRRVECSPRYDVQVASDSAFLQIVFRENTPHRSSEFVAPVAQHRYWWRVHSNACGIASHWSNPQWFKAGSTGPLAPEPLEPGQGEATGPAVTFSWNPGSEAVRHKLQIATTNDFSTTVVDAESLVVDTFDVEDLTLGQTYYWRVAGFDDDGRYTFSATRSFSVATTPSAVSLIQPEDKQTGVPAYTVFTWDPAEGADAYRFELSNATDFSAIVIDTILTEATFKIASPLAYASEHFWRVCGVNIAGEGPWTSRSFTVAVGTATEPPGEIPLVTEIGPAYPNPASQSVHFRVALAEPGRLEIAIYDMTGRLVARVEDEGLGAGRYTRNVDISHLSGGVYVAMLRARDVSEWTLFVVAR